MAEESVFAPGVRLADGIELKQLLRRGVAWEDWAAWHEKSGAARVRVLDDDLSRMFVERPDDLVPFRTIKDEAVAPMLRVGQLAGCVWVAYGEPEGVLLSRLSAPPPEGRGPLPLRHAFGILLRATRVLDALRPVSPAGVIAYDDVLLTHTGRIVLLGVGTARLALAARGGAPWGVSVAVAPEVRSDRWSITEASDVYSLGGLGVALLCGREVAVDELATALEWIERQHGRASASLLRSLTDTEAVERPFAGDEIRAMLNAVLDVSAGTGLTGAFAATPARPTGVQVAVSGSQAAVSGAQPAVAAASPPAPAVSRLSGPVLVAGRLTGEHLSVGARLDAPTPPSGVETVRRREPTGSLESLDDEIEPAAAPPPPPPPASASVQRASGGVTVDLFAGLDLLPETTPTDPEARARWIYTREGRDYGPVSAAKIRELLVAGEIDEHTAVADVADNVSHPLVDVQEFTDFVIEWLPKRAQAKLAREEKRERVVTEVRRSSRTALIAGLAAALALAGILSLTRAAPEPLPMAAIVGSWPHRIEPPRPEYQSIAADDELLAALFNFDDPAAAAVATAEPARRERHARSSTEAAWQDEVYEEFEVRFDDTAPTRKLTSEEINATMRSNVGDVRDCLLDESRGNPDFGGANVNFSIRPDGRTFNISVDARGPLSTSGERCLITAFRGIRFPTFNDVPMSISFPLTVR